MEFLNWLFSLFKQPPKITKHNLDPIETFGTNIPEDRMIKMIDWSNPESKISEYFTVHEATWLPSWKCYHTPSEEEKENIVKISKQMDKVRDFLEVGVIVHVWIRPRKLNCPGHKKHGKDYNRAIGGSAKSAHTKGSATDWHASGFATPKKCAQIRKKLLPKIEEFGLRMEDIVGGWIHNDNNPVGFKRFFKP